ncbi:MAG: hypothetical protein HYS98_01635, partial [Deltaproteobacteria bacterium]|nr:hypothetical protein [Deltaproteobacteria bacterium]
CSEPFSRLAVNKVVPKFGRLKTWTRSYIDLDQNRLSQPVLIGFIEFKGFEGGLIHKLGPSWKNPKIGSKVSAVFVSKKQRHKNILDIKYFDRPSSP